MDKEAALASAIVHAKQAKAANLQKLAKAKEASGRSEKLFLVTSSCLSTYYIYSNTYSIFEVCKVTQCYVDPGSWGECVQKICSARGESSSD